MASALNLDRDNTSCEMENKTSDEITRCSLCKDCDSTRKGSENPLCVWLTMDTRTREKHVKHMKNSSLAPLLFGRRMYYSSKNFRWLRNLSLVPRQNFDSCSSVGIPRMSNRLIEVAELAEEIVDTVLSCLGSEQFVHSSYHTYKELEDMSLFTFFLAVCVVLQMIGMILTGDAGGLLKSLVMCEKEINEQTCKCCDSIMACRQGVGVVEFEGVQDCSIITGLLTGLMYGLCVLTIFGSLLCFIATILGCIAVARETSRHQGLCGRHSSRRSHPRNQERYTWAPYPTDLTMLPPYAPPVYHSVENFQDYGISSCIVPPPVFDPTDLPPPYSSQNPSLAESQYSLSSPESSSAGSPPFSAGQETEVRFQLVRTNCHAENHDQEDPVAQAHPPATCSTPSGIILLEGSSPPWEAPSNPVSHIELFSASGSSDLSSDTNNRTSSDRETDRQSDITDSSGHKTVISRVTPFKVNHPTCSTSRIQAGLSELVRASTGSRKRTSSLDLIQQETSTRDMLNARPVAATYSCPVRATTILSLRTLSRSLGENSIYVNSFEVMTRPPPNVRLPVDELLKPSTTDSYFNTRNAQQHTLREGTMPHKSDALIELHGSRRSE